MAHYTVQPGNAPMAVAVGDAGATFTNSGTGTLYYGYDEDITETTSGIGTISAGASAGLYGNVYLYVPRTGSRVDVEVAGGGATLVVGLREQRRRLTWLAAELYYGVQAVLEDWQQWRADCRRMDEEHDRYVAEHRE
jgi:hypothetical protein